MSINTSQFIIPVVFFCTNTFFLYTAHYQGSNFYNNRIKKQKTRPMIYDISCKYLPNLSSSKVLEYSAHFIAFILPFAFGAAVRNEYFSYIPILFLIRSLFISITILPKEKHCDDSKFSLSNLFFGHCYDKIFSGHFVTMNLISLILLSKNQINIITFFFMNIIYAFVILLLRFHYTIDLIVGFLITLLIYQNKLNIDRFIK